MAIDFNCNNDYVLEDDIVLLRPMQENDLQYLLPYALQEPFLWTFSLKNPAGEEGMKEYISDALKAKKEGKEYPFVVWDKQAKQYAGSTRFYDIQLQNQTLQLGYTWYGKAFQGTGLNKHCKFLLLSFSFEQLGMERVEFRADAANERSVAAMKSIGCTAEGILRSNVPTFNGRRRNSIILSILKEEWFSSVKEQLKAKLR